MTRHIGISAHYRYMHDDDDDDDDLAHNALESPLPSQISKSWHVELRPTKLLPAGGARLRP